MSKCPAYCPPTCEFTINYCDYPIYCEEYDCTNPETCTTIISSDCVVYEGISLQQYGIENGATATEIIIQLANLVFPNCTTTTINPADCVINGTAIQIPPFTTTTTTILPTTTINPGSNCVCYTASLRSPFSFTNITYTTCENVVITRPISLIRPSIRFCAIENSVSATINGEATITNVGDCSSCPILPPPVVGAFNISWVTTIDNPCDPNAWTISLDNLTARYDLTDSLNCGGTCDSRQKGTATATINTGPVPLTMGISVTGLAEARDIIYDRLYVTLDGIDIEYYSAPGGNLPCVMGAPIQQIYVPGPFSFAANSTHTLKLDFDSLDALHHISCFYQAVLTFT
jgi:hypothetical protein